MLQHVARWLTVCPMALSFSNVCAMQNQEAASGVLAELSHEVAKGNAGNIETLWLRYVVGDEGDQQARAMCTAHQQYPGRTYLACCAGPGDGNASYAPEMLFTCFRYHVAHIFDAHAENVHA